MNCCKDLQPSCLMLIRFLTQPVGADLPHPLTLAAASTDFTNAPSHSTSHELLCSKSSVVWTGPSELKYSQASPPGHWLSNLSALSLKVNVFSGAFSFAWPFYWQCSPHQKQISHQNKFTWTLFYNSIITASHTWLPKKTVIGVKTQYDICVILFYKNFMDSVLF